MTPEMLLQIVPYAGHRAEVYAPLLTQYMESYFIDSPKRQSCFIAQIAHESESFLCTQEIASGAEYENRADLGDIHPGDGMKYKGRGLIQITGRKNYVAATSALEVDLLSNPEQLEQPDLATKSACWFWSVHGLNKYADIDHFGALTRAINGGYNGLDERIGFWLKARSVLCVK